MYPPTRNVVFTWQIRQDAMAQSEFYSEMSKWEKDIRRRDNEMKSRTKEDSQLPPVRGGGTITAKNQRDPEVAQRELGNAAFGKGDYAAAVKAYTLCLGLKKRNHIALSNRAMAYLRLKEYHNAESDATAALLIDPNHLKSLHRRATARKPGPFSRLIYLLIGDALGKHRAALVDIHAALQLQPANKALATEAEKIKTHLRTCASAAPFTVVHHLTEDE